MNQPTTLPKIYSLSEAAARLGISVDTVRRLDRERIVPLARVGGDRVVTEFDLQAIATYRKSLGRRKTRPVETQG